MSIHIPRLCLEIEETRAFDVTDQTDPNVTDEVCTYMNRHCILWTFMVRDLKYRHTKKITDFSAHSTFNKGELGN